MREFKIGDKVKIPSEPDSEWVNHVLLWVEDMNVTCGEVLEIKDIYADFDGYPNCLTLENDFTYRPEYLLTEPYNQEKTMKAEDIDLTKEQVFETPIEGFKFSHGDEEFFKYDLKAITRGLDGKFKYFDSELYKWNRCQPIQAPQPKTRPMTHFEILKLVDSEIYFRCKRTGNVYADWGTNLVIDEWECCLRSDFQKAETLEDVVWKKIEVKA